MSSFARRKSGQSAALRPRRKDLGLYDHKSSFHSSRIKDLEDSSPEAEVVVENEHPNGATNDSESDSETDNVVVKPYSSLLQSLNATHSVDGKPARKKRKLSFNRAPKNDLGDVDRVQDALEVEEPEFSDESSTVSVEEEFEDDEAESVDDGKIINCSRKAYAENKLALDPFEAHFAGLSESFISQAIKDVRASTWKARRATSIDGWKEIYVGPTEVNLPQTNSYTNIQSMTSLKLKQRLRARVEKILLPLQDIYQSIVRSIFNYKDLLFCERTHRSAQVLRTLITIHSLNHVLKTRDRVLKNTLKLSKIGNEDVEFRDQGFTRPKVLFILPTRQSCANIVESIVSLYEPEQQENKKRFNDAYNQTENQSLGDRPEDFRELFAGNDDDMFRIGMKFTRKSVKLFSRFYNSDIIFTSPLGLRMAIGMEGSKKQDSDFLSSIEVVIVEHADALLMQNWEHVEYAFNHMNLQPKEAHGCDFSRVRNWYLDGNAKYLRQTIITSSFNTPEINKLFTRSLCNIEGKFKVGYDTYNGAISDIGLRIRQTFSRYYSSTPASDPDARFKQFTATIVPNLDRVSRSGSGRGLGVLIFVPSYLDFVRIRNFLATDGSAQNISFGSISEYTSVSDTARARSHFITGRHSVLLYTGRAHHFNRLRIRGSKKIVFYSLPENPIFYREVGGQFLAKSISEGILDPTDAAIQVMFSKWDVLKLERVVGSDRMAAMMNEKSGGDTFDFL